ncbi:ABC transporter permease [Alloacidobacterium dinghuense]|uniref:ABC transporter permease n=1 Tax=Alloacidobacterium dinghuense TaxID=2763107 RepID=A0A7G8BNE8_9BACT|nr:ABC transporter permease [Alloacidobacterium dinghuense]QNI34068.1 ABC transporter permease [Alloacidobacterium dinghuense]
MRFRFALRQLRKNLGFTITAVLTLAIGIGATTAIFSLVYAVLLRPLPFPQPECLVHPTPLWLVAGAKDISAAIANDISYPDFFDWRAQNKSFDSLASYHSSSVTLNSFGSNTASQLRAAIVSSDFFRVLGINPTIGRTFTRDEERPGSHVVVLSHDLWVSSFHSDPSIVGQRIMLDDQAYTVIGVMKDFAFPETPTASVWLTPSFDAETSGTPPSTEQRGWNQLEMIGRLKPGVSIGSAQAELNVIQKGLSVRYPDSESTTVATKVEPEIDNIVGDIRPALRVLFAAVAALLLIACANIAGLLLARGEGRQSELAVRTALGANRSEIVRQLLGESLILSLLGGVAGVALAFPLLKLSVYVVPANLPRFDHVSMDGGVLAFAFAASVITGLIFGVLPARKLSRIDPAHALRDGGRGTSAGRQRYLLHAALVVAETAMGLVLLVAAGLLIRSFTRVLHTDPGFNPQNTLTFGVGVSKKRYPDEKRAQLYRELLPKFAALPGVKSATAVFPLPFGGGGMDLSFQIQGHIVPSGREPDARMSIVESNYLHTMQIRLLRGRDFTDADNTASAKPVALINAAFAKKYFPNEDAIGKGIMTGLDEDKKIFREIVGITGNVKQSALTERDQPEIYVSYESAPFAPASFALRVGGDPASYVNSVTSVVTDIDRELTVYRIRTYADMMNQAASQPRFQTLLLSGFAAVALLLAAIGLYAVLSYMVAQRTFEIGLRMAIGAQRTDVLRMILQRGLRLAVAGLAIGLVASALLTSFLSHMLYGVKPLDPVTFIAVSVVLLAVSAAASFAPAWRASQLEPMKTLRDQ